MATTYPWYDSSWLTSYRRAHQVVNALYPERLDEFTHAFDPMRTRADFEVIHVPNILSPKILADVRAMVSELKIASYEKQEIFSFGRLVFHDHDYFNQLQRVLAARVSEAVEEPLECSYNFLSLYNKFGVCQVHMDAPSAKWTLDACINQSAPWPIYFSQVVPWPEDLDCPEADWETFIKKHPDHRFNSLSIQPGDGVIFSGSSQWHYRERIPQRAKRNFCHLIFFHFIAKGTRPLADPKNWAHHFGIPELVDVVVKCDSTIG